DQAHDIAGDLDVEMNLSVSKVQPGNIDLQRDFIALCHALGIVPVDGLRACSRKHARSRAESDGIVRAACYANQVLKTEASVFVTCDRPLQASDGNMVHHKPVE